MFCKRTIQYALQLQSLKLIKVFCLSLHQSFKKALRLRAGFVAMAIEKNRLGSFKTQKVYQNFKTSNFIMYFLNKLADFQN